MGNTQFIPASLSIQALKTYQPHYQYLPLKHQAPIHTSPQLVPTFNSCQPPIRTSLPALNSYQPSTCTNSHLIPTLNSYQDSNHPTLKTYQLLICTSLQNTRPQFIQAPNLYQSSTHTRPQFLQPPPQFSSLQLCMISLLLSESSMEDFALFL